MEHVRRTFIRVGNDLMINVDHIVKASAKGPGIELTLVSGEKVTIVGEDRRATVSAALEERVING